VASPHVDDPSDDLTVEPGDRVLVTGASGYIGGRLVGELVERGYRVRCLARTPAKLGAAPWSDQVEVVQGDITGDLDDAMRDVAAVYYLVHTIGKGGDWVQRELDAAANVRDAAGRVGVHRIVYLGGLGDDDTELSEHLWSRHEVGRILAEGPTPVTELRAAIIIGSGSASFEMLRYLVEVLPVMVTPSWVETRCQPIAVRDVLRYLVESLREPRTAGQVLDVGGPDVLTYRQLMGVYAEAAGLRRRVIVPVPLLSPRLSSHWVGLVTPLPYSLSRPLVASLVNEVVVTDDCVRTLLPGPLFTCRQAIDLALARIEAGTVSTRWDGAELGGRAPAAPMPTDPSWAGGTVLADRREARTSASPAAVHRALQRLGGDHGWHSSGWMWWIRGAVDKLVGGVGMRRGRRHPSVLRVGDAVDFWRVEAIEPDGLLRLRAEMRLPGDAWLEWRIEPDGTGSVVHQFARFHPRGLWGRAYWLSVAPFHPLVFRGLLRGIVTEAEADAVTGSEAGAEADGELSSPGGP
jgi:uncharacterized protein YbjT (DUF2867 family)